MARTESVASGGYFPTPQYLIGLIAAYLEVAGRAFVTADPCAGDGEAVVGLVELCGRGRIHTCEMEAKRHAGLVERLRGDWTSRQYALHGDAFRIHTNKGGLGLLFLNPPYDLDSEHGRLEQRFLERFTPALTEGGVLVFIVPHYALAASAETLATEYESVSCYRFPDPDFATYKQVVLFAKKCDKRLAPDRAILARVNGWAKSAATMKVLGDGDETFSIPSSYSTTWRLLEVDIKRLVRKARPWRETRAKSLSGALTNVAHTLPEIPIQDLLFRTFPVATAVRPAHIGAGIASGLFNGREVESETKGFPNLLVKGVFDRDYTVIEEKKDADGKTTSVVQVQAPRLVTTVLNLKTMKYSTVKPAGNPGATRVEDMGLDDLLTHYGPSLLDVMEQQCPVIYDPARDDKRIPLGRSKRRPYRAQKHAAKALLSLLGGPGLTRKQRRGKAAILLGELGVGKTTTSLAVGLSFAKRMFVMCPPTLLKTWTDEVKAMAPNAEIRILSDIADVDAIVDVPADKFLVAIVSREKAKLGHGWVSVKGLGCPKCGARLPSGDLAKKRVRCDATPLHFGDALARDAFALALRLAPVMPDNAAVQTLLEGRHLQSWLERLEAREPAEWRGFDEAWVTRTLAHTVEKIMAASTENAVKLMGRLLLADYKPERIASLARTFAGRPDYYSSDIARELCLLLPKGKLQDEIKALAFKDSPWSTFDSYRKTATERDLDGKLGLIKLTDDGVTLDGREPGSAELAAHVLNKLASVGHFPRAAECGEPLFQAVPEPARYPLSKYIARRYPDMFDFLVLDEGHEFQNGDTAQSHAAHRMTALGIPTILQTGSVMNGYAASLFTNMWYLSPDFRAEFGRDEIQRFIDRYGYRKQIATDRDKETGEVVEFGAVTDRVQRTTRNAGESAGILPLFLFRHLLKISVTLQKSDLALDLPPCHQIKETVELTPQLSKNFDRLQQSLVAQIRKDLFVPGLAGKLFGALSELPSYLDRATADAGNQDDGSYEIRYPTALGSGLVATVKPLPASKLLPKEEWMVAKVKAELAEGRNVMVLAWHVNLLPRLQRILEKELGEKVPVLYADKVPTGKRQDWIQFNIVDKGARVMVANPVAISTGLNNLVHFATQIWMENPACNPITFRQTIGRIDRIGKLLESRIYIPVYAKARLAEMIYQLFMRKVAVSIAADGLDNESALMAAGAGEDAQLMGMSIGKQLWALLNAN